MKFISVHQNGEEILVNTSHIVKVEQRTEKKGDTETKYTALHLTDSTHQASYAPTPLMRVSETLEEVKKLLV